MSVKAVARVMSVEAAVGVESATTKSFMHAAVKAAASMKAPTSVKSTAAMKAAAAAAAHLYERRAFIRAR